MKYKTYTNLYILNETNEMKKLFFEIKKPPGVYDSRGI
jgi:hypothetical protein